MSKKVILPLAVQVNILEDILSNAEKEYRSIVCKHKEEDLNALKSNILVQK
jgi:hypothetical protein